MLIGKIPEVPSEMCAGEIKYVPHERQRPGARREMPSCLLARIRAHEDDRTREDQHQPLKSHVHDSCECYSGRMWPNASYTSSLSSLRKGENVQMRPISEGHVDQRETRNEWNKCVTGCLGQSIRLQCDTVC